MVVCRVSRLVPSRRNDFEARARARLFSPLSSGPEQCGGTTATAQPAGRTGSSNFRKYSSASGELCFSRRIIDEKQSLVDGKRRGLYSPRQNIAALTFNILTVSGL